MSSSRIINLAKSTLMHNVMHRGRKLREEECGLTRIFLWPNAVIIHYNCRWHNIFRNMVFIQHIFLILEFVKLNFELGECQNKILNLVNCQNKILDWGLSNQL